MEGARFTILIAFVGLILGVLFSISDQLQRITALLQALK